jgi:hypothetical protein
MFKINIFSHFRLISAVFLIGSLMGCQSMSPAPSLSAIPASELMPFTPLPADKRIMDVVTVKWDVRPDASEFCAKVAKMSVERAYFTPPLACAYWVRAKKECTIVTLPTTSHAVLGHELRHCFEGQFH